MSSKYGVIGSGTTPERLILWGAGYPVIELDVEDQAAPPRITLVGDECSGGASMEIEFDDAMVVPAERELLQSYEEPLREAQGWQVGTAVNGGSGLYVVDPAARYQFELVANADGLTFYLRDATDERKMKVMAFSRKTLDSKGAWPVMPVADLAVPQAISDNV